MIEFLSANWYWLFAAAFVWYVVGILIHLNNARTMLAGKSGVFVRFGVTMVFMAIASACGVAGSIGVVVVLIDHFKR